MEIMQPLILSRSLTVIDAMNKCSGNNRSFLPVHTTLKIAFGAFTMEFTSNVKGETDEFYIKEARKLLAAEQ